MQQYFLLSAVMGGKVNMEAEVSDKLKLTSYIKCVFRLNLDLVENMCATPYLLSCNVRSLRCNYFHSPVIGFYYSGQKKYVKPSITENKQRDFESATLRF